MRPKATKKNRKELVVSKVIRMDDESLRIKAAGQWRQRRWTTWEAVTNKVIRWADMWKIPQTRLSFIIRSTYDTLLTP